MYLIALWHDKGYPEQRPKEEEQQNDRDPPSRGQVVTLAAASLYHTKTSSCKTQEHLVST